MIIFSYFFLQKVFSEISNEILKSDFLFNFIKKNEKENENLNL